MLKELVILEWCILCRMTIVTGTGSIFSASTALEAEGLCRLWGDRSLSVHGLFSISAGKLCY
jgi:hypothetical protein